MKHILLASALAATAMIFCGCADTSVPAGRVSAAQSGSAIKGAITQAANDDAARQTQEDAQRMSDWINQQNNLQMMNQANQMANQAAMDASNAAAQAAADSAATAAASANQ